MSTSRRQASIATRLMLGTALVAVVSFGLTAAISYWKSSTALLSTAAESMRNLATVEAGRVSAELGTAHDTAATLAGTLLLLREQGRLDRASASALMRAQLQAHPEWIGVGTLWEPDAFDGRDAEHVGAEAHDETGRFMSYWAWNDGTPISEPLRDYEVPGAGDWYRMPRERREAMLVEPYEYQIGGRTILMTTLSMPILEGDRFLGMVTVDIALSSLQERLSALRPLGEGHIELLSPAGRVLASPDPAEVGRVREDATTRAALTGIARGDLFDTFGEHARSDDAVAVYAPMQVGSTAQRFAMGVIVPHALLMQQARSLLWLLVLVGLGAAVVLSVALSLLLRRQVVRPLSQAAAVADDIANGTLDTRIDASRGDEIGDLMRSMLRMQGNLRSRIEQDAALARENLRIRTALDDVTTNVMIADADRTIIYANRPLLRMLAEVESDIQRDLPQFQVATVVGGSIDVFHRHPEHQSRLLSALSGTHKAQIQVGGHIMQLIINPVSDAAGDRIGYAVEWADRTAEVQVEQELSGIVSAAAAGDLSGRVSLQGKQGFLLQLAQQLNALLQANDVSLAEVSRLLTALSAGDLTARMEGDFHGVFAKMRDDANATVEQLTSIVGRIQQSNVAINTAATEIASGNNDLSRRTEQQAANLEETAASMEELTSTVKQNADHARQANQLTIGAASVAAQGGQVVGQVVTTMADIQASSRRIADIISVIDGIAFQTNILALNAAVEAARAGEQGRGFAVVATEVRSLAQRSATAAKEIKGLIEDSTGKVETGSALAQQAGATMGELVASVQRVTDIMAEISAASQEQAAGIEQVNQTITQMDETTQQNAALVEEATAAARAMEEQAAGLGQAISVFRFERTAAPAPAAPRPRAAPLASAPPALPARPPRARPAAEKDWAEF
ncbi:methyl-accepting chemotaxis protein [Xanthomonas sp. XNM01]|uniref:methyl-accepting chemotaxis protein n=1 Tax=Xanthomonas sp. XNM01 TaxID=2769289 RepID=UPI001786C0DC|nr:methyl-accepting chemotaxis protein [Xanthomonas sp. XNM01]MBD9368267.1 HAMP domain-containing protein [Xanthomonas sp. XNM01]